MVKRKQVLYRVIINLYTKKFWSANMISKAIGYSRAGVIKVLKRHGVDISGNILLKCVVCGKEFYRPRNYTRKVEKKFCSQECYLKYIENNYSNNRACRKRARKIIKNTYPFLRFLKGFVIHHVNGDECDNNLNNLVVFKNQVLHIKFHRLGRLKWTDLVIYVSEYDKVSL